MTKLDLFPYICKHDHSQPNTEHWLYIIQFCYDILGSCLDVHFADKVFWAVVFGESVLSLIVGDAAVARAPTSISSEV